MIAYHIKFRCKKYIIIDVERNKVMIPI